MHVIEAINNSKKLIISLEITPPNKGQSIEELFGVIDPLSKYDPAFISVTYHQPQVVYEEKNGVIYRVPISKKPARAFCSISLCIFSRPDLTVL